jgi:peptidoglycan/LPS O-acetylase OafA/YrhL
MATDLLRSSDRPVVACPRLTEIDGIRGWAALVVVLAHFCSDLFQSIAPIFHSPHFILFNGRLAVDVFFILSGDALSFGYLYRKDLILLHKMALKRYFRLTMPIVCSCFLVWVLMVIGWDFHQEAAILVKRESWLGVILPFSPDFLDMIYYSLIQVYAGGSVKNSYNPILWTIAIEFLGSGLVLAYLYLFQHLKKPIVFLLGVTGVLFVVLPHYSALFIGVGFGYLRWVGVFSQLRQDSNIQLILCGLLMLLLMVQQFLPMELWNSDHWNVVQAAMLIFIFYGSTILLCFFKNEISQFLGRLSYPIYVIHFPVLISLSSYLIVIADRWHWLNGVSAALIVVISIGVSFSAAYLLMMLERVYLVAVSSWVNRCLQIRQREIA